MIVDAFDIEKEKLFCARCGRQCVPFGHTSSLFLLCPLHGEFTIAPVVIKTESGWQIHYRDQTEKGMWDTCRQRDQIARETVQSLIGMDRKSQR